MKRICTIFTLLLFCICAKAQYADYELVGFVDENDQVITSLTLAWNEDFVPRVALKNNGPSTIAADDTLSILFYVDNQYISRTYIPGERLTGLTTGRTAYFGDHVLFTAEQLDALNKQNFSVCYEVSYLYDIVPDNNRACIAISNPVGLTDYDANEVNVYPNPAANVVNFDNVLGATIFIYDLTGKVLYQGEQTQKTLSMEVSNWNSGLYFARLVKNNQVSVEKFYIAH